MLNAVVRRRVAEGVRSCMWGRFKRCADAGRDAKIVQQSNSGDSGSLTLLI